MGKTEVAGKVLSSGLLMVIGSGLVAWGTKGIEEVTPIVIEGMKRLLKK